MVHGTLTLGAPPYRGSMIKCLGGCRLLVSTPWRVMIQICIGRLQRGQDKETGQAECASTVLTEYLLEALHWTLGALGSVSLLSAPLNSQATLLYHVLLFALHNAF